jgi:hypothetical protein
VCGMVGGVMWVTSVGTLCGHCVDIMWIVMEKQCVEALCGQLPYFFPLTRYTHNLYTSMVKKELLAEFIDAVFLSSFVESPHEERGGIFLVGPPASMKTSIITSTLGHYPQALLISDLNVQTLIALKSDITSKRFTTVAFKEFSKLYERDPRTASNIEGHIRALADEGFSVASFQDQRMASRPARAVVIGAMTENFYSRHFTRWIEDGFVRRFLWLNLSPSNPMTISDSIVRGERIPMNGWHVKKLPQGKRIPWNCTEKESAELREVLLVDQVGKETPLILLQRVFSVYRWKYGAESKEPMARLKPLREVLSKRGGELEL